MTTKKIISTTIRYCLLLTFINTLIGCSTPGKQQKIISVQKKRIHLLKRQLNRQQKVIGKLKQKKWINQAQAKADSANLGKIDQLIKQKNWVGALKLSTQLKKQYPKSIAIHRRRYLIFNRMGLKKQAAKEYSDLRKLRAYRKKNTKSRKL